MFARLLDEERGGSFRFVPSGRELERDGVPANTNVLRTEVIDHAGRWEVIDFAPRTADRAERARADRESCAGAAARGTPRIRVRFDPRPDYARPPVSSPRDRASKSAAGQSAPTSARTCRRRTSRARAFHAGRSAALVRAELRPRAATTTRRPEVINALEVTVSGWRAWVKTCALPTFAPEAVLRSALCLKLHAYHDTGAIIAAATTSIPEAMGTERTWDYRYCWLRDAAFVVEALRRLWHLGEGEAFMRYLRDVAEAGPLQPVYGIGGERELPEEILPHLAGFGGNGPCASATRRPSSGRTT